MDINYKGTKTKITNDGIFIFSDTNNEKTLFIKDVYLFEIYFSHFNDEIPKKIEETDILLTLSEKEKLFLI